MRSVGAVTDLSGQLDEIECPTELLFLPSSSLSSLSWKQTACDPSQNGSFDWMWAGEGTQVTLHSQRGHEGAPCFTFEDCACSGYRHRGVGQNKLPHTSRCHDCMHSSNAMTPVILSQYPLKKESVEKHPKMSKSSIPDSWLLQVILAPLIFRVTSFQNSGRASLRARILAGIAALAVSTII